MTETNDARKLVLSEQDHADFCSALESVLAQHKRGEIEQSEAVAAIAHAVGAIDLGNVGEYRAAFTRLIEGVATAEADSATKPADSELLQKTVSWMVKVAKASGIWDTLSQDDAVELATIIYGMLTKSAPNEPESDMNSMLKNYRPKRG